MTEGIRPGQTAGSFRAEEERCDGRTVDLPSWLVTTANEQVSATVAGLYGGRPRSRDRQQGSFELTLDSGAVAVSVDGSGGVVNRLVLDAGEERGPTHICDGLNFLEPMDNAGDPCGCPDSLFDRKAAARSGRGPKPDARLTFRLMAAPDLGLFNLTSSSWAFSESLSAAVAGMECGVTGTPMEICLRRKVFTTRSGMTACFVRPVLSAVQQEFATPNQLRLAA
ncbi:hypothetical protein O1L44_02935 [Streptomyces noursei]|uniref:hypothetical protein n=1 Tax=Streptomyces noursei TaxID=1971 RepID=UPI0013520DF9|nr:hypothetical protein [Streptomyces noursei]